MILIYSKTTYIYIYMLFSYRNKTWQYICVSGMLFWRPTVSTISVWHWSTGNLLTGLFVNHTIFIIQVPSRNDRKSKWLFCHFGLPYCTNRLPNENSVVCNWSFWFYTWLWNTYVIRMASSAASASHNDADRKMSCRFMISSPTW